MGAFGEPGLNVEEFRERFAVQLSLFDDAWILAAPTKKGTIPVGITYGKYVGPILFLGDTQWFPWASSRNKLEVIAKLLNVLRKKQLVMFYCNESDKSFYVNIARYGVIRRVGTIHDLYEDGPAALFQSRNPKWAG